MKKRLITSALPYVNNIPHLGNLIQVLSADVFARFCRMRGYETLYVCGTDEYGTATETKAREEGISPRELCDRFHVIHKEIYDWFSISFDKFGRTSSGHQTSIVQDIFKKVQASGFVTEHTIEQLYSEQSQMFLADRYIGGTCPHCAYPDARGDQCENCGKLLDPSDLINPISIVDGSKPVLRQTKHLYINLPALKDKLETWMKTASAKGKWAKNAVQMTQGWIRDGLKERAITRDLKWGIPVPVAGFEDKVFYVWFDAPIGYISITAEHTTAWKDWWQNPDEVELFQFIGKDNIPFHTVIFPSSLLATGDSWTMLHHMSSSEYLNYESGKFSKSKGIGVFGTDAKETGIPADVWRFYIFYNRPETSDYTFTWKDFQEKTNKELIGNIGNLVNRTLSLWHRYYDDQLPAVDMENAATRAFWKDVGTIKNRAEAFLEWADLRDGLRTVCELSGFGNKVMQDTAPWSLQKTDPVETRRVMTNLLYLVRDIAIMLEPYLPQTAEKIAAFFGLGRKDLLWSNLGKPGPIGDEKRLLKPELLFQQLDDDRISDLRERFSGSQAERKARETQSKEVPKMEQQFADKVDLRVARITGVEKHPEAAKLYIETLDDGTEIPRTIVSGLVPFYKEEELIGKHIILVANLKPAKLRGVVSQGMLLAASTPEGESEIVEVLELPQAKPGDRVLPEGFEPKTLPGPITIDEFFALPVRAEAGFVKCGNTPLAINGLRVRAFRVSDGTVG